MANPTPAEIEIAETRATVAQEFRNALGEAIEQTGDGARAYAQWVERDKLGELPDRVTPCRDDGEGWRPLAPHDGTRLPDGRFRWTLFFHFIGAPGKTYRPKTAEQLAQDREQREHAATVTQALTMPLLAEQIADGLQVVKTKNQLRREKRAQLDALKRRPNL